MFYKPLTKANIRGIVDLLANDLKKRLSDKRLNLVITDEAKDYIADKGYDPVYGARPLKRFLQSAVENAVAKLIIASDPEPDSTIEVSLRDGQLTATLR